MKATNMEIAKAGLCTEGAVRKARERLDLDDLEVLLGWVLGQRVRGLGLAAVDGIVSAGPEAEPEDREPTDQEYMDELGYIPVKEAGKTKTQEILDECFGDMETTLDQSVDGYTYVPKPSPDPALPLKADTAEEVGKILENKKQKGFEW